MEAALRPGDQVPHVELTRLDGARVAYADIWQRRNLLLVSLPDDDADTPRYLSQLAARMQELTAYDTECVVTARRVDGVPRPGVLLADRWGEIHLVTGSRHVAGLPSPQELVEWLRFVQVQCPECQGEAR